MHVLHFQENDERTHSHEKCQDTSDPNLHCLVYPLTSEMTMSRQTNLSWQLQQHPTVSWDPVVQAAQLDHETRSLTLSPQIHTLASLSSTGDHISPICEIKKIFPLQGWNNGWIIYCLPEDPQFLSGKYPKPSWIVIQRSMAPYCFLSWPTGSYWKIKGFRKHCLKASGFQQLAIVAQNISFGLWYE